MWHPHPKFRLSSPSLCFQRFPFLLLTCLTFPPFPLLSNPPSLLFSFSLYFFFFSWTLPPVFPPRRSIGSTTKPGAAVATTAPPPLPRQQAVVRAADPWPHHSCLPIAYPWLSARSRDQGVTHYITFTKKKGQDKRGEERRDEERKQGHKERGGKVTRKNTEKNED